MRKKLLLLTLAAALMLTACAGKSDKADEKQETAQEAEAGQEEKEEDDQPSEAEASQDSQTQMPESEEPEEEPEEAVSEFSKGIVSESGWESQWIGLRFTAPEGTKMTTEEELAALMGISEDLLSEDLSEAQIKYAELTSVKEMMCYDEATNTNVIVGVDRMPIRISEEVFADQIEQSLTSLSAMTYERLGENETVDVAGIPYLRTGYRVEVGGQSMYMDYYVKMIEDRAVSLVLTYGEDSEELTSSMMEGFQAY